MSGKLLLSFWILFIHSSTLDGRISNGETLETVMRLKKEGLDAEISQFRNYGDTVVREEVIVVKPTTVDGIRRCLRVARDRSVHVRVAGARNSWSELFPEEGNILLDMLSFHTGRNQSENQIVTIAPNSALPVWQVRASSTLTLHEVNKFLLPHGLVFPSPSAFSGSSLAGIISTASHGSHWLEDSMSDYVTAMTIMTGEGDIREYTITYDPEVIGALRACVGACGIILDITLAVQPIGKVGRGSISDVCLGDLFIDPASIHWLMKGTFSWSASWELYNAASPTDRFLTENPGNGENIAWRPDQDKLQIIYFNLEQKQTSFTKKYVPDTTGINASELIPSFKSDVTAYLPELVHIRDNEPEKEVSVEVEFFIKEEELSYNGSMTAVKVLTDLIWDWIETLGNLPLHRVEFSWMRRSRNLCYLCPSQVAEVSGLVFSISMHVNSSVAYTFRTHTFFERYYKALRENGLHVFPHLGKRHAFLSQFWFRDKLQYHIHNFRRLLEVRRDNRLDVDDIFLNKHLRNVLLNPAQPQALASRDSSSGGCRVHPWLGTLWFLLITICFVGLN